MRAFIKRIISSSSFLSRLFLKVRKKHKHSKDPKYEGPLVPINAAYGHEHWLKSFSHFSKDIKAVIEHGLYFGGCRVVVGDKINYCFKKIITFSQYRLDYIKESFPRCKAMAIGPLVAYVPTDEEYKKELIDAAKGNKKILTVFPSHSIEGIKACYDGEELVNQAIALAKKHQIDNIYFCLVHHDIDNGYGNFYKSKGFKIVSAGFDSLSFLPRLRAILESSTLTLSNGLGTNLGYSVFLGTQQVLLPQMVSYQGDESIIDGENKTREDRIFEAEIQEFAKAFGPDEDLQITKEQYDFCDYYFGFSKVLEPEQLHELLEKLS